MYSFCFYFLYRIIGHRVDDSIFTTKLLVFIISGLHLVTLIKIGVYFQWINNFPKFSEGYLNNKLIWFIPLGVLLFFVLKYFNNGRVLSIIENFSSQEFIFSFWRVLLFCAIVGLPVFIISYL